MAARKNAPATGLVFEVAEEGMPVTPGRGRKETPILTLDAVRYAFDNDCTIKFALPNETFADLKSITNDLRRAGTALEVRVNIKANDDESVVWVSSGVKKEYTLSVADIREWARNTPEVAEWAAAEGLNLVDGRLDKRVRELYKRAHSAGQ